MVQANNHTAEEVAVSICLGDTKMQHVTIAARETDRSIVCLVPVAMLYD